MIVKVQVPLASSETNAPALVYDEARSFNLYFACTPELMERLNGRPKAYFEAKLNEKQELELGQEVPMQRW
jgi:hypothetical protein